MVTVEPGGGLCNRLRTVNSAYFLAKQLNQKLRIVWKLNKELNCAYEKLFKKPKNIEVLNYRYSFNGERKKWIRTADTILTQEDISVQTERGNRMLPQEFIESLGEQIYINTCQQFMDHPDYHLFVPTEEMQTRIDVVKSNFGNECVGVHIRRTDSMKSIETSTTDGFVDAMRSELEKNSHVRFYLATDDPGEEEKIKKEFPGKVLTLGNKTLDRNSEDGVKDAMVDFMCLAGTKRLIGSYWSSFTDMAADFYKIPVYIVGGETDMAQ